MGTSNALAGSIGIDHVTALISAATLIMTIAISKEQKLIAEKIHTDQKRLSQRQFLVEIYREFNRLNSIADISPWYIDVSKAVNILEFIGVAVDCELVDVEVVDRLYRQTIVQVYEQIYYTIEVPGVDLTGKQLLARASNAESLYRKYKKRKT